MRNHEDDDPWTYFGSYSRVEVDGAAKVLSAAGIDFEIQEDSDPTKEPGWKPGGWTGPFNLWVRDESTAQASGLLIPFFAAREKRDA